MVLSASRLVPTIELPARMSAVRRTVLVWHPLHMPCSVKACLSTWARTASKGDMFSECQGLSGKLLVLAKLPEQVRMVRCTVAPP